MQHHLWLCLVTLVFTITGCVAVDDWGGRHVIPTGKDVEERIAAVKMCDTKSGGKLQILERREKFNAFLLNTPDGPQMNTGCKLVYRYYFISENRQEELLFLRAEQLDGLSIWSIQGGDLWIALKPSRTTEEGIGTILVFDSSQRIIRQVIPKLPFASRAGVLVRFDKDENKMVFVDGEEACQYDIATGSIKAVAGFNPKDAKWNSRESMGYVDERE